MAETKRYPFGRYEVIYRNREWWSRIRDCADGMLMGHGTLWDVISLYLKTEPDCDHGYARFQESCDDIRKELNHFSNLVCADMDSDAIEVSKIDGNCVLKTMIDTQEENK